MASAPLLHARCCYSPRFSSSSTSRNAAGGPLGSSPSSSSSCCSSSSLSFGACSGWRNQGLRAHAMTRQGGFASSSLSGGVASAEKKPDHLLVLVHSILARPSDWTYVEAELRKRLGRNFLIYASSCNTYTKRLPGLMELV